MMIEESDARRRRATKSDDEVRRKVGNVKKCANHSIKNLKMQIQT